MALWGPIYVNRDAVGEWSAVRQSAGFEADDAVFTYSCEVVMFGRSRWEGQVEHRFGDGAVVLAGKVLGAAGG